MSYRMNERHLTCPFDATHTILPHRMPQHLIKCRKNHPGMDMKTCPFNATHLIVPAEYKSHIVECPNKAIVERCIFKYPDMEDALDNLQSESNKKSSKTVCEEDWESELSDNPDNAKIIIEYDFTRPPPPGMKGRAGRREWRVSEIERVNRLRRQKNLCEIVLGH